MHDIDIGFHKVQDKEVPFVCIPWLTSATSQEHLEPQTVRDKV
jgi:hypothetical protein